MKNLGWRAGIIIGVVAVCVLLSFPNAEKRGQGRWLNLNLGLDLQGGSHLVLEVVTSDALAAEMDTMAGRMSQQFRQKGIPFESVHRDGDRTLVVSGVTPDREAEAEGLITEMSGSLLIAKPAAGRFTITLPGPVSRQLEAMAVQQTLATIRNRIDQFGVTEPSIQEQGGVGESAVSRIVLQLPGVEDPSRVKDIIQTQARLEWKELTYPPGVAEGGFFAPESREALEAMFGGRLPEDTEAVPYPPDPRAVSSRQNQTTWWPLKKVSSVAGSDLRSARRDENRLGQPAVAFELSPDAGRRFERITRENLGKIMAIVLDGKVISAPVIRGVINANGIIEGSFTRQEAEDLALKLRSGALPARVNIVEERTVGPSLGRDSIRKGVAAAVIGFASVMIFMLIYYKASGVNATLALVVNVVMLLGAMSYLGATMTLPGIAGLILTVGMSVDSNVLIFERIREELELGKTVRAAIDTGFSRVLLTIIDTHVTTLVSAFFLFMYGTGPVKGFAVTLSIGLLSSIFTAVFVSRFIYDFVLSRRARVEQLSI